MYKYLLLLLTALTLAGAAMAQDSMSTAANPTDTTALRSITLPQAIDIALKNNYQIKEAKNNLDLTDMAHKSAIANFFPNVSASMGANRRIGKQFNSVTISFANQTNNTISGDIGTSITIFSGLNNIYNLRRTNEQGLSMEEQLRRQRENVIFYTANDYLQVLLDKQLLEIARENLKAAQQQLDQVKAQVEVGSKPVADQYAQEATVANDQLQVIQNQNTLNLNKLQLVRQLQLDPLKEYQFVSPALDTTALRKSIPPLPTLISEAMSNRSDLKSQEHLIQANYFSLKQTESQRYPSLTFSAQISGSYYDTYRILKENPADPTHPIPVTVGFGDQFFNQNVNKFLGFNLSIPIFNRLNTSYQIQSSLVNYKNSKLELENLKLQIVQEMRQAYNDFVNFAEQLTSTEIALTSARKAYETQQERYKVGSGTLIELSQANATYVQARAQHEQALYQFIFQRQLINYYMGQISANMEINGLKF